MARDELGQSIDGSIVTAALRAAVAWTQRGTQPGAWREISRMTGVVCHALGPGRGPSGPLELVRSLREPLAGLLDTASPPRELAELVMLDADDHLTDAAIEVGCEYTQALFERTDDPAQQWLPAWAWQRAEQVEREVFERLISSGDDERYTATRRFLIEHPAGEAGDLIDQMNTLGASRCARYEAIPPDRVWRDRHGCWWWPCPVCRWPMRVKGTSVECGYGPHDARFRADPSAAARAGAPGLVQASSANLRAPDALSAEGMRCVELPVWRFVTVPGVPELDLERRLLRIDGIAVQMWPGLDRVDLVVRTEAGRQWEVDVKDHVDPMTIVDADPAAHDIVVPDYRRVQVRPLQRAMPNKRVRTISGFTRDVRAHARGLAR